MTNRNPLRLTTGERLDIRLSVEDKNHLRRAAALHGKSLIAFVREAALREAEAALAHRSGPRRQSGRAPSRTRHPAPEHR